MIEIIEGLPDNVVGFVATGRVTSSECDSVLLPAVREIGTRHHKPRLYYELECRFPGAAWEDLDIAPLRLQQWERVALVTDVSWVRHTVKALRFLIPAEVRVFPTLQADEGRDWVTAA
ncbi:MAG: STAS/SEC14 domain-containing protein [Stellaceae bacterium]